MSLTQLLPFLKGASPLDIFVLIAVLLLGVRWGWWELKKQNKKPKGTNEPRHKLCIGEIHDLTRKIQQIELQGTMKKQMMIAEDAIEAALRLMRDLYFDSFKALGYDDATTHASIEVKHYNSVIEILSRRWRKDIQSMMRENGLAEKSEAELQDYLEVRGKQLIETGRIVFDTYYGNELRISRTELHHLHKTLYPKLGKAFEKMIRDCRNVAFKAEAEIAAIEQKIEVVLSKPCPKE